MAVFQFHLKNVVGGLERVVAKHEWPFWVTDWPPGDAGPMSFPSRGFRPSWAWILRATAESPLESSWGKFHSSNLIEYLFPSLSAGSSCVLRCNWTLSPIQQAHCSSSLGWTTLGFLSHFSNELFRCLCYFWSWGPCYYPQKLVTHVSSSRDIIPSIFCMPFHSATLGLEIYLDLTTGRCIKCISLLSHTEKW